MKPIELTGEHKNKLRQMCDSVFPGEITVSDDFGPYEDKLFIRTSDKFIQTGIFIHWFEFCITHLADKLLFEMPSRHNKFGEFYKFCKEVSMYNDGKAYRLSLPTF